MKNWCQAVWSDCVTAVGVLHMRNLSEMADIPLSIPNFVKFDNLKFYEINWLQNEVQIIFKKWINVILIRTTKRTKVSNDGIFGSFWFKLGGGKLRAQKQIDGPRLLGDFLPDCHLLSAIKKRSAYFFFFFFLKKFLQDRGLRGFPLTEKQICPPKGKKMIFFQFERSKQRASVAVFKRPTRISLHTDTHTGS